MTTTSDSLATLLTAALMGKTGAGNNVFAPRDWPTSQDDMPILLVQSPSERKESIGKNAPQFNVTATIRVNGRVTSVADAGDAGAVAVQGALATLQRQIEVAVINNYHLTAEISEFVSVDTRSKVSSEGEQHIGELTMDFELLFYQGPEDFAPTASSPLEEIAIYSDFINVFDPTGTYPPPPVTDPVVPAARTKGPDGRIEGEVFVELPQ